MALEQILIGALVLLLVIIISALPLHLAAKSLGGKSTILKSFLIMIIVGIISILLNLVLPAFGTILTWIILIVIFKEAYHIGWLKSIFVWLLWIVFVIILAILLSLLGLSVLTFSVV
ncbi:MAG: hypothetical protein ACOCXG_02345 [Nanoarchaeota archaeon]